jgi:hypothetical protein
MLLVQLSGSECGASFVQDAEDTLTEPQILKHNESCGSYGAVELLPCQGAVVETTAALTM